MSFADLGLTPALLRAVADKGYDTPTPIQRQAIPAVLARRDVLAGAQTGTGKTAGFVLPILQLLDGTNTKAPRALILTPTRELAAQVAESAHTYGSQCSLKTFAVFGGVNIGPQMSKLRNGCDILVATPGRLLDLAQQRAVDLRQVQILVLDEADRMLDMGFINDIRRVIKMLPEQRQNLMFSATYSDDIRSLANKILRNPLAIDVAPRNAPIELVEQKAYSVQKDHKRHLLVHLIKEENWHQVLIFTRTKHGANRLTQQLERAGIQAAAIHGNKSQAARVRALQDFKVGEITALVATEVAARGLDIKELPQVVNYELPNVPEDYVHRIGRTGRAGTSGKAISLVSHDERNYLREIERLLRRSIPVERTPEFVVLPDAPRPAGSEDRAHSADGQRPRRPGGHRHAGGNSGGHSGGPGGRHRHGGGQRSHSQGRRPHESYAPLGGAPQSSPTNAGDNTAPSQNAGEPRRHHGNGRPAGEQRSDQRRSGNPRSGGRPGGRPGGGQQRQGSAPAFRGTQSFGPRRGRSA